MKSITIVRAILRLVMIAIVLSTVSTGCVREQLQDESIEELHEVVFHAGWDAETKTALQEDGSVFWSQGDEISLFVGNGGNGGYKLTSINTGPAAKTDFIGTIGEIPGTPNYVAVHPYHPDTFVHDDEVLMIIPNSQVAQEGSFDSRAFVSVAVSDNDNLYFKNVCGGIKFSVANEGIEKITIKTNEVIAGSLAFSKSSLDVVRGSTLGNATPSSTLEITAPDNGTFLPGSYYYVVIPAMEYSEGFTITYHKGKEVATFEDHSNITIKRSTFKRLYNKDAELRFMPVSKAELPVNILPDGVDKAAITEARFYVNSNKVTDVIINNESDGYESVYFEQDGSVVNYYTKGDVYIITAASSMFKGWKSLKTLDLSTFNTDNVYGFSEMFYGCNSLEELNLSSFNTENSIDFRNMFNGCISLKALDVSNFDTSNAIDMYGMFCGCSSLSRLDVSGFETKNVSNFGYMFSNCWDLNTIEVSGFDTHNATYMGSMFEKCLSLTNIDVTRFNTSKAEFLAFMFSGCKALRSINVTSFDTKNVNSIEGMFGGCASLTELDLSKFNFQSAVTLNEFFSGCSNLVKIDIDYSTVDPEKLVDIKGMYMGCEKLRSVDLSGLKTPNVTQMSYLFRQCYSLETVNLGGLNTEKVQSMDSMFESCVSLPEIDLSSFNTSSVSNMSFMFDGCSKLKQIDLSSFNTESVTNMSCMFRSCINLRSLNISSFDATSLTNASELFCFDFKLESLDMGSFDLSKSDLYDAGSLTARNSEHCNVRCIPSTKEALEDMSRGFSSEIFVWYCGDDIFPEYHETIDPNLYYSSDYSMDGKVKVVQTATSHNAIDIVLMGDGYSDRLIANGKYDRDMDRTIEAILSVEPYMSYQDLINIYVVYAVSENEVIGKSTAFSTSDDRITFRDGIGSEDSNLIRKYARMATDKWDFREVAPIVVLNSMVSDGAVWTELECAEYDYENDPKWDDYHGGESITYVSGPDNSDYEFTVRHECGHSIGQLDDEYGSNELIDGEFIRVRKMGMNYGQWKNIDFTNNPEEIKWRHFLYDSRYINSDTGIYEGGAGHFSKGVWRPSPNSIMGDDENGQYNAPSREAIYYRIHKLAYGKDWEYNYEDFVQQDLKNIQPKASKAASAKYVPYPERVNKKHLFKVDESTTAKGKKMIKVVMD